MTESKRDSKGRFKKKKESGYKNPDCEPATKGFVKCIARKVYKHVHNQCTSWMYTLLAVAALWVSTIASLWGFGTSDGLMPFAWYPASTTYFVGAIVATAVFMDLYSTGEDVTYYSDNDNIKTVISKYEPPVCKDKKECD